MTLPKNTNKGALIQSKQMFASPKTYGNTCYQTPTHSVASQHLLTVLLASCPAHMHMGSGDETTVLPQHTLLYAVVKIPFAILQVKLLMESSGMYVCYWMLLRTALL